MLRDIDRNGGMTGVDALMVRFQCPKRLKRGDHIRCGECAVGINIDTNRLANAAKEMRSAMEKMPPEITIKFFR
jgi:hypothetical protein